MAVTGKARLNGVDVEELEQYIDAVRADPHQADRDPEVIARWVGGMRSEVVSTLGGPPVYMGGDDDPSPMGMLLRALVACCVEVLVTRATLLGVDVEELRIEATGFFHVARYLGVDAVDDGGYQRVAYTAHLKTRNATLEQIDQLREALATSPVADTFARHVAVEYDLVAS